MNVNTYFCPYPITSLFRSAFFLSLPYFMFDRFDFFTQSSHHSDRPAAPVIFLSSSQFPFYFYMNQHRAAVQKHQTVIVLSRYSYPYHPPSPGLPHLISCQGLTSSIPRLVADWSPWCQTIHVQDAKSWKFMEIGQQVRELRFLIEHDFISEGCYCGKRDSFSNRQM